MKKFKEKNKKKKFNKKKCLLIILISLLLIIAICGGVLLYLHYNINLYIKLNGENEIKLLIGEEYKEPGFKAYIYKQKYDITKDVKVTNEVDTSTIGSYLITYNVSSKYFKKKAKATRIVTINDETAPVIELKGKEEVSIYVNEKYNESGVKVEDNYDKDLEEKVVTEGTVDNKKVGEYEIKYSVTDSSGNTSSVTRKVIVKERPTTIYTTSDPSKISATPSGTGKGLPILMYHFFYDQEAGENGKDSNYMEIHAFEEQVRYLKENDYYFPTWVEVEEFVKGEKNLPSKSVVITVDDGNATFFRLALPIIEKYQVKATSFIITERLSTVLSEYPSNYVTYQSHTHSMHKGGCSGGTNSKMRCIPYEEGVADMKKSFEYLSSSDALAYPFGDANDNAYNIAKGSGIKVAVTTAYGKAKRGMDPLKLPRIRMSKGVSLSSFVSRL